MSGFLSRVEIPNWAKKGGGPRWPGAGNRWSRPDALVVFGDLVLLEDLVGRGDEHARLPLISALADLKSAQTQPADDDINRLLAEEAESAEVQRHPVEQDVYALVPVQVVCGADHRVITEPGRVQEQR